MQAYFLVIPWVNCTILIRTYVLRGGPITQSNRYPSHTQQGNNPAHHRTE